MAHSLNAYILRKLTEGEELSQTFASGVYRHMFLRLRKYFDDFCNNKSNERLIIMYGLRGIGKTTLLLQLYKHIRKHYKRDDVLYISCDELVSFANSSLSEALTCFIEDIHGERISSIKKNLFLLIDEAHFDEKWELITKSLFDRSLNLFIVVTGSSAIALQQSTDTKRRSKTEPLFPLNFKEYEMIKHSVFPKVGNAESLKRVVLEGDPKSLVSLQDNETAFLHKLQEKNLGIKQESINFMKYGGFTTTIHTKFPEAIFTKNMDVLSRVVNTDLPQIKNMETSSISDIFRVLGHFAIKKPGETSYAKISSNIDIPIARVKDIIDSLERTHLIFPVKPYSKSATGHTKTPWKYYFLTPTILCALRNNLGVDISNNEDNGTLLETTAAASLFRFVHTSVRPVQVLYDKEKKGNVDFLIRDGLTGKIIPIEVGANKDTKQVVDAMKRYKSDYGIVVTNCEKSDFSNNIFKIPVSTFIAL